MRLYEIEKTDVQKAGGIKNAVISGAYILRDDNFIHSAFNFGNGTKKDFNRYMKDNSKYCVWIDAETMKKVSKI